MELFRKSDYSHAKDAFSSIKGPSPCSLLGACYYHLSDAAQKMDVNELAKVKSVTEIDPANFNALKPTYLQKLMTDVKVIRDSIFDYNGKEVNPKDTEIIEWYWDNLKKISKAEK